MAKVQKESKAARESSAPTRVDSIITKLKNHPLIAGIIVVGIIAIAIGNATDAVSNIREFLGQINAARQPTYAELMRNVARYVIDARIERRSYTGPVVITPVGLFGDPGKLADGSPTGYTYLLCRFTNTSGQPVTIGAVTSEHSWYRLDDIGLGYHPTLISLSQMQMWFGGKPVKRQELLEGARDYQKFAIEEATLPAHATKYAYVNSLGSAWPKELTLTIIDVTDNEAGSAKITIDASSLSFPAAVAHGG